MWCRKLVNYGIAEFFGNCRDFCRLLLITLYHGFYRKSHTELTGFEVNRVCFFSKSPILEKIQIFVVRSLGYECFYHCNACYCCYTLLYERKRTHELLFWLGLQVYFADQILDIEAIFLVWILILVFHRSTHSVVYTHQYNLNDV